MRNPAFSAFLTVSLCSMAIAATAQTAPATSKPAKSQCFFSSQWRGWRAPDDRTVYIRVGGRDIYRLDLTSSCPGLRSPGAFLINRVRGGTNICSPLDLDLRVSQGGHFSTPCLVKSMTKLSPDEVTALPKSARP